jgi:hypothetical protein
MWTGSCDSRWCPVTSSCQHGIEFSCLTKHHTMKMHCGVEVQHYTFLTLELEEGERSASCHSHFTPKERAPGTHWIGGWVSPRIGLDVVEKRKIPSAHQELKPDCPACSQSLYRLSYPGSSIELSGCIQDK